MDCLFLILLLLFWIQEEEEKELLSHVWKSWIQKLHLAIPNYSIITNLFSCVLMAVRSFTMAVWEVLTVVWGVAETVVASDFFFPKRLLNISWLVVRGNRRSIVLFVEGCWRREKFVIVGCFVVNARSTTRTVATTTSLLPGTTSKLKVVLVVVVVIPRRQ